MNVTEIDFLENASVKYCSVYKKWEVRGSIIVGQHKIDIPSTQHDTFDEAAICLKDELSKACIKFTSDAAPLH